MTYIEDNSCHDDWIYVDTVHGVSLVSASHVSFWPLSIKRKLVRIKRQYRARTGRRT